MFIDSGILNINKPLGWTSARVVSCVKKKIKVKKVGHCGTLDPRAGGVLVVCFGKATRLSQEIMDQRKIYRCVMRFGLTTATGDLDGDITSIQNADAISMHAVEASFKRFTGHISQVPPMYSALKLKGEKLYEIARRGETIARTARQVWIHTLDMLTVRLPEIEFRIECSKGTYIRTLVEDIGNDCGCGAVLISLVREAVGPYHIEQALLWEDVCSMSKEQLISRALQGG